MASVAFTVNARATVDPAYVEERLGLARIDTQNIKDLAKTIAKTCSATYVARQRTVTMSLDPADPTLLLVQISSSPLKKEGRRSEVVSFPLTERDITVLCS